MGTIFLRRIDEFTQGDPTKEYIPLLYIDSPGTSYISIPEAENCWPLIKPLSATEGTYIGSKGSGNSGFRFFTDSNGKIMMSINGGTGLAPSEDAPPCTAKALYPAFLQPTLTGWEQAYGICEQLHESLVGVTYTTAGKNWYVGAYNKNGTAESYSKVRIYSIGAATGDSFYSYLPARRKSDSAVGLLDVEHGNFYTTTSNQTAFIDGPTRSWAACTSVEVLNGWLDLGTKAVSYGWYQNHTSYIRNVDDEYTPMFGYKGDSGSFYVYCRRENGGNYVYVVNGTNDPVKINSTALKDYFWFARSTNCDLTGNQVNDRVGDSSGEYQDKNYFPTGVSQTETGNFYIGKINDTTGEIPESHCNRFVVSSGESYTYIQGKNGVASNSITPVRDMKTGEFKLWSYASDAAVSCNGGTCRGTNQTTDPALLSEAKYFDYSLA